MSNHKPKAAGEQAPHGQDQKALSVRTITAGGWCWQNKAALRTIREKCPEPASALGAYLALTVADSDAGGNGQFIATHHWLAALSGFSERTIRARLRDLEAVGLVSTSTPAMKVPSTFRLLPSGNGCRASGNGCRASGNGEAPPLPPSEERKKRMGEGEGAIALPVDWPTEGEAVAHAANVGCGEDFARLVWNDLASRGGTDLYGQPIQSFRHHLVSRWIREKSKKAGRRTNTTGAPQKRKVDYSKGW